MSESSGKQLQPLQLASPGSNLEGYMQMVSNIPLISAERERELTRLLHDKQELEAARELVLSHLRFVVYVARSYSGYGLPEADLIQEGNVGLMKAVRRFNPDYGVRLVSFAVHWIRAEIHEYILRNWRIVKIATTKAQRKLFFNLRSSRKRLGWMNQQEVNEVADALGVEPKLVEQMESRLSQLDESFDGDADADDENHRAPVKYLSAPGADPARLVEQQDAETVEKTGLALALKLLDARSADIIRSRWLSEQPLTLHQLAARYEISAERIRQLEKNALKKMRGILDEAVMAGFSPDAGPASAQGT